MKARLSSGYAFKLESAYTWRAAPNDDWDTVVIDALPGKVLGTRSIDGSRVTVVSTDDGIYAQLSSHVRGG